MGTGWASYKAGVDIEKIILTQSCFSYREQQIDLNLYSVDIFNIPAEQVSQQDMKVGCLLGLGKLLCLFWTYYSRFRIGIERLKRGALATILYKAVVI